MLARQCTWELGYQRAGNPCPDRALAAPRARRAHRAHRCHALFGGGVRREMEELHGTIKTDFRALKLQSLNSINPAGHVHPEARL